MNYLWQAVTKALVIAQMETKKLFRDPMVLVSRSVQPILWLGIFGQALSRVRAIPTDGCSYLQFITPGILTQSVVFIAIFYGLEVIWEKDLGLLQKFLITPTPRLALVWGKMLASGIRGLCQVVIVFIFAMIIGIQLTITIPVILCTIVIVLLGAAFFTGLSMVAASIVKTRERFMGIGQVITLPLFFASNAIYPIAIMPGWLQIVANVNPLSYMVNGLRTILLSGGTAGVGFDIGVLAVVALLMSIVSAWLYPRVVM
jgi:ABC-2 type transport system permease protein